MKRHCNGLRSAFDALIQLQTDLAANTEGLDRRKQLVMTYLKNGMQRELLDFLTTEVSNYLSQYAASYPQDYKADVSLQDKSVEFVVSDWASTLVNDLDEDSGVIDGEAYRTRNRCKWAASLGLGVAAVAGALLLVTHFGFMPFTLMNSYAISVMVVGGIALAVGAAALGKFLAIVIPRHAAKQRFQAELGVFRDTGGVFHLEGYEKKAQTAQTAQPGLQAGRDNDTLADDNANDTTRSRERVYTDCSYSTDGVSY